MKPRLIIAALAAAFLAVSCAPAYTSDPMAVAIVDKIAAKVGEGAKVTINTISKVDSVTFANEIEYRRGLFEVKISQEQKFIDKYEAEYKPVNAAAHRKAMRSAMAIQAGLETISEQLGSKSADVAYYVYCFTGTAKAANGQIFEFKDFYAAVSPECEVIAYDKSRQALRSPLGVVIPGYAELLDE